MNYKTMRKIMENRAEYVIDMSMVCELAHEYTENECIEKGIRIDAKTETGYSEESQKIFDKHYKLITEILNV